MIQRGAWGGNQYYAFLRCVRQICWAYSPSQGSRPRHDGPSKPTAILYLVGNNHDRLDHLNTAVMTAALLLWRV